MPPMPAEADAPPDFDTPETARPDSSASRARFSRHLDRRHIRIEQIEIRKLAREQCRIGEPGKLIFRRHARHGDSAFGKRIEAVALDVVGRDRGLLMADQHAQADVVALGALRFLDGAVAHVDGERDRAHGDGIGLVGAGAACGGNESFSKFGEGGLIEERGHFGVGNLFDEGGLKERTQSSRHLRKQKSRQDVRSGRAMQPALPKNDGIAATSRQSCDVFQTLLLALNQGF